MSNIIRLVIVISLLISLQSCAVSFQEKYPKPYKKYLTLKPIKALAFAKGENGRYVWGYGSNFDTVKEAKERALFECKARRKPYQIQKKCEIYFVNDDKALDKKHF